MITYRSSMLFKIFIGFLAVSGTVVIHAMGTAWWLERLRNRPRSASQIVNRWVSLSILIQTALVLIGLHVVEVFVWALIYHFLPASGLASFEEAMYFSFTTFTTLGYGDLTLEGPWRLLTGIESLNGVLLIGWSTALSFAVIQRVLELMERGAPE